MAVSGAKKGHGGVVRVGRGSTPTWTVLPGVGDFAFPDPQIERIDVTSHSSPAGIAEFIPGITDLGTVGFQIDHVPGGAIETLLLGIAGTRESVKLELTAPGGTPEVFDAYLAGYKRNVPVKEAMKAELTWQITGMDD